MPGRHPPIDVRGGGQLAKCEKGARGHACRASLREHRSPDLAPIAEREGAIKSRRY
ncbi:hypothetical protein GCM10008023_03940 [Sphingomonas glacialis]|uniref:Propionyl-coenzyme A carboxylase alpha polypeptide n=1 Tax=Sphingomonas glacialis TaxID=658225 RepID=A0ABQ3L8H7_9SPHN|nr:hypothetical protein GCM10008023_03940 [Sphingomonas glacialis]